MTATRAPGSPAAAGMFDSLAAHELGAAAVTSTLRPRLPYPFEAAAVTDIDPAAENVRRESADVARSAGHGDVPSQYGPVTPTWRTDASPKPSAADPDTLLNESAPPTVASRVSRESERQDDPLQSVGRRSAKTGAVQPHGLDQADASPVRLNHRGLRALTGWQDAPDNLPATPGQRGHARAAYPAAQDDAGGDPFDSRRPPSQSPIDTPSRRADSGPIANATAHRQDQRVHAAQVDTGLDRRDPSAAEQHVAALGPSPRQQERAREPLQESLQISPLTQSIPRRSDGRTMPFVAPPLFQPAPEPVIEIHIGRVDVRAQVVRDPVPSVRQADSAPRGADPLAAYLGKRNRGARS